MLHECFECHNRGIEVLPPDVNHSGYDFTIEEQTEGKASFALGLVLSKKWVRGSVETIIQARGHQAFRI